MDQKNGNSLLYLPLDKLMGGNVVAPSANPAPTDKPAATSDASVDATAVERSREAFRSRDREYR